LLFNGLSHSLRLAFELLVSLLFFEPSLLLDFSPPLLCFFLLLADPLCLFLFKELL